MLERKITNDIEKWFEKSSSALLVDGARQIGKTTVIDNFLFTNKIRHVKLNLYENKLAKDAFDNSTNVEELMFRIRSLTNDDLKKGTVIFIDEIQEAIDPLTPIKFLVQSTEYKYIFSGSLLGVKMKDISSIPVGFLKIINMYPMDFEEFLWANKVNKKTIAYLKEQYESKTPVDEIVHKQMMAIFKTYLTVGGMPEAVFKFVNTKNLTSVNMVLEDINEGYKKDIAKYQTDSKLKIQEIYDLIPSELNAQNKRFIIKNLNEKGRFYQYETSFAWLKNSGVGLFVHNVDNPVYPLLASKERTLFKLFLCDTGLLAYKLYGGKQIVLLDDNASLNCGAIYESVVAQELKTHNFELYYNSDKKRGEIDFLIEKDNKVIPLEIKSGKDYKRHSALNALLGNETFGYDYGLVFCNDNIQTQGKIVYMPIYMIMFLTNETIKTDQIVNLDVSKLI